MQLPNIISAEPLSNYFIRIIFDNNLEKEIDIKPFIKNGVSATLKDEHFFKLVKVEDGFISWPNGFDFCPLFLYNL
jgi:Protein of unknown function (DUF2442)